jgi:hypothetical protein
MLRGFLFSSTCTNSVVISLPTLFQPFTSNVHSIRRILSTRSDSTSFLYCAICSSLCVASSITCINKIQVGYFNRELKKHRSRTEERKRPQPSANLIVPSRHRTITDARLARTSSLYNVDAVNTHTSDIAGQPASYRHGNCQCYRAHNVPD